MWCIEHVRKNNCVASNMCARKVNVIAPHPIPPPPPHPTKPLRALSENENLRGVQAKLLYVKNFTGSPVTPPPENRPSQKDSSFPTIHFQRLCSFQGVCVSMDIWWNVSPSTAEKSLISHGFTPPHANLDRFQLHKIFVTNKHQFLPISNTFLTMNKAINLCSVPPRTRLQQRVAILWPSSGHRFTNITLW